MKTNGLVPMVYGPKNFVKPLVPMVPRPTNKPLVLMAAFQTIHLKAIVTLKTNIARGTTDPGY